MSTLFWCNHNFYLINSGESQNIYGLADRSLMEITRGIVIYGRRVLSLLLFATMALNSWRCVRCINEQEITQTNDRATSQLLTELVYNRLFNLTAIFSGEIKDRLSFCVKDVWGFIFSSLYCWIVSQFDMHIFNQWVWVCIKAPSLCRNADWNGAFNFSSNLGFLSSCIKTKGAGLICLAEKYKCQWNYKLIIVWNHIKSLEAAENWEG